MSKSFVTVRNPELSLWQSAVKQATANQTNLSPELTATMRAGTDLHVQAHVDGKAVAEVVGAASPSNPGQADFARMSEVHFRRAQALAKTGALPAPAIVGYWDYSDYDSGWFECIKLYNSYYVFHANQAAYNEWKASGKGLGFGVLDYQLPNDAKVLILGDWGTGQDDAQQMLVSALKAHNPQAIIHLGDIYYSGTQDECQQNYIKVFNAAFAEVFPAGPRPPVFMIPGNHEYYSGGQGFYYTLGQINQGAPTGSTQQASYFCLRTKDQAWQFLAMDTGVNDHDANMDALGNIQRFSDSMQGPGLVGSEIYWHEDKLTNFGGSTVLLSHHQFFSANAAINGSKSGVTPQFINQSLNKSFSPFFSRISAWFWGHEHNLVVYDAQQHGLAKGRLVGNSAYEELTSDNPYVQNFPVAYNSSAVVSVSPNKSGYISKSSYYNHSYAVIDLQRKDVGDGVQASYFQYDSWGITRPDNVPPPSLLFTETLESIRQP